MSKKHRFLFSLSTLFVIKCLSACSSLGFPGVFKIDVAQGNILTQEMVDLLKPGLEKQQVLYVAGQPLIEDMFNADRWDYVYYFRPGGKNEKMYHVVLHFEGNYLSKIDKGEATMKMWHQQNEIKAGNE